MMRRKWVQSVNQLSLWAIKRQVLLILWHRSSRFSAACGDYWVFWVLSHLVLHLLVCLILLRFLFLNVRELGNRKTMGMVSGEIQELFLAEAMIMGFGGGLGGLLLGAFIGKLISYMVFDSSNISGSWISGVDIYSFEFDSIYNWLLFYCRCDYRIISCLPGKENFGT